MRFLSPLLLARCPSPKPNPSVFSSFRPRFSSSPPDLARKRLRSVLTGGFGARGVVSAGAGAAYVSPSSPRRTMAAAEEGSVARRFWIRSQKEAALATYTPFVVCLAAGRLELESFRQYIAQDVHFLRAFAQAYEKAEEYADDDDAKATIFELRKAVLEELKMHNSIVEEWGIDPTKEIIPSPATVKYTNFLLATAAGKVEGGKGPGKIATPFEKTKIAVYTIGAMTPCMRLYSFLGKELQMFLHDDGSEHPFKKWIENYSFESFEASTIQIEELLDKLSVSLTGEELEVIEKLYHQAMKLEIEFFSAQLIAQPVVIPLIRLHDPTSRFIMFSDFDLTCTVVDSSAILAEIAIRTAPKADESEADNTIVRMSSSDLRKSWDALSSQYTEEYEHCIESILQSEEAKAFDYEGLYKGLEPLSDFEKRANSRVIESGVLRGMNLEDIRRAGERLILQDGCTTFFGKIVEKKEKMNIDLHLLSYCWCADLIRSAFSSGCLNALNIHSNEFEYEGSVSTGTILRKMKSPMNKVEAFKTMLSNGRGDDKHLSVYFGDSVGDLLCLLQADMGIVVGSSPSLRRVGKHFGVFFCSVVHWFGRQAKTACWRGLLYLERVVWCSLYGL